ncbi:MAG: putative DNA-binding transcriptional regulator AlpA [Bacteriovoracaceae bacterium]|jgi:predicted DNA-binding transcriptional regulator AlpA
MYFSVKEASQILSVSKSSLYKLFKNDPTFPAVNIGVKKKIVIHKVKLNKWISERNYEIELIRLPSNRITFIRRHK